MAHPSATPSQQPVIDVMSSSSRLLAGCLLASVVLHVVVALGLPGWWSSVPPQTPAVLDVVLIPQALVAPATPVPPVLPPVNPKAKPATAAPAVRPVSVAAAAPTDIALPATTESAISPVAETVRAPAAAPAPSVAARADQTITPPVFNAAYLRNPPPRYPPAARRNSEEGTVVLRVLVTTDGTASRTELDRSSGSATLDGAALEAVRSWRFVPARRGTLNIEDWVRVPVVFRLESWSRAGLKTAPHIPS